MRLFSDVASSITDPFMRRAFELAEKGRGTTSPNPVVGCVIAQDDEIVGEGYHARAGEPHAEVMALRQAGPRAAGATAYVTLEPCNHTGRTPACSEALISRGVAGVVIGMPDPNPVAVGGAARMREAGLEVEFETDPTPYELQNEGWLHFVRTGRPFVRVKVALTLDGHAAIESGVRCAITGVGGAAITRRLRAAADAVVVGASTARIDDPALTVRDENGAAAARQPLRVVWGRSGVPAASLFTDGHGPAVALVNEGAQVPPGVESWVHPAAEKTGGALRVLAEHGVVDLLVEAGPQLFSALWYRDYIDELVVVHAGGIAGPQAPPLWAMKTERESSAVHCEMVPVETGISGEDAVTAWRPRRSVTGANSSDSERKR
jgi:diaminohydroxyphosphoribosylaminopyrimidine deaminase/5-amino-6-(5-phosphoribosylamino)uracil reductase